MAALTLSRPESSQLKQARDRNSKLEAEAQTSAERAAQAEERLIAAASSARSALSTIQLASPFLHGEHTIEPELRDLQRHLATLLVTLGMNMMPPTPAKPAGSPISMPPPPPRSDAPAPTDVPSPPAPAARAATPNSARAPPQSTPASSSCDWVGYLCAPSENDANPAASPSPVRADGASAPLGEALASPRPMDHSAPAAAAASPEQPHAAAPPPSSLAADIPTPPAPPAESAEPVAMLVSPRVVEAPESSDDVRAAPASPVREADEPATTEPAREEPSAEASAAEEEGGARTSRDRARRRRSLRLDPTLVGLGSTSSEAKPPAAAEPVAPSAGPCDATLISPEEPTAEQQLEAPAEGAAARSSRDRARRRRSLRLDPTLAENLEEEPGLGSGSAETEPPAENKRRTNRRRSFRKAPEMDDSADAANPPTADAEAPMPEDAPSAEHAAPSRRRRLATIHQDDDDDATDAVEAAGAVALVEAAPAPPSPEVARGNDEPVEPATVPRDDDEVMDEALNNALLTWDPMSEEGEPDVHIDAWAPTDDGPPAAESAEPVAALARADAVPPAEKLVASPVGEDELRARIEAWFGEAAGDASVMSTAALVLSAAALTVVEHSMEAMLPWMQAVVRAEVASTLAAQREAPRSAKKSRKRVRFQQYDFSTVSLPQDTVRDSEHACETVAVALELAVSAHDELLRAHAQNPEACAAVGALIRALGEVAQAIPPALTTVASDGPRDMTQSEIRGAARLYAAELECVLDGSKQGSQLRARFSELVSAGVRFHLRRLLNPVPPPLTTPPAVRAVGAGSEPGPHDWCRSKVHQLMRITAALESAGNAVVTGTDDQPNGAAADGALASFVTHCLQQVRNEIEDRAGHRGARATTILDDTAADDESESDEAFDAADAEALCARLGRRGGRGEEELAACEAAMARVSRCRLVLEGACSRRFLLRVFSWPGLDDVVNTEAGGWAPLERYAAQALSHRLEDESHFAALADIAKLRETLAQTEPRTDARRRTALSELTRIARAFGGRTASNATTPAASSCGAADAMVTRRDVVAAARDAQRRAMLFPDLAPAEKSSPSAGGASPRRSPDTDM